MHLKRQKRIIKRTVSKLTTIVKLTKAKKKNITNCSNDKGSSTGIHFDDKPNDKDWCNQKKNRAHHRIYSFLKQRNGFGLPSVVQDSGDEVKRKKCSVINVNHLPSINVEEVDDEKDEINDQYDEVQSGTKSNPTFTEAWTTTIPIVLPTILW